MFDDHKMYNGYGAGTLTTTAGAQKLDITKTGTFAGRGVMLDPQSISVSIGSTPTWSLIPSCSRLVDRHKAPNCAVATSCSCVPVGSISTQPGKPSSCRQEPGSVSRASVLMRCRSSTTTRSPRWCRQLRPVEKMPFDRDVFIGVHVELLVKRGITLLENLYLSELSADGCTEFLLVVGALKVTGAAGSPINPVAIG